MLCSSSAIASSAKRSVSTASISDSAGLTSDPRAGALVSVACRKASCTDWSVQRSGESEGAGSGGGGASCEAGSAGGAVGVAGGAVGAPNGTARVAGGTCVAVSTGSGSESSEEQEGCEDQEGCLDQAYEEVVARERSLAGEVSLATHPSAGTSTAVTDVWGGDGVKRSGQRLAEAAGALEGTGGAVLADGGMAESGGWARPGPPGS
jgi:hypothetical protein